MKGIIALVVALAGCENSKKAAIEEAQKAQEAEASRKPPSTARKITPPVTGEAKLPCDQVINVETFQKGLEEVEPLAVKDVTAKKGEVAADCNIVRGGKKLTEAEQKKLLKEKGRLGILSGDVICNVKLLCYSFESHERVKERCQRMKERPDESMGTPACVQVVPTGIDDVEVYKFFDEDTKCVFEVRGGPSNVDNNVIRTCAKLARDSITPAQLTAKPAADAPAADGSGSGS